jgi:nucleoid-associated protein YgaU
MRRVVRFAFVVALVAGEAGAVLVLQRLGRVAGFAVPRHAVCRWMLHAPTEELFAVAARLVGLALAWWLLAATVLSLARRVVPGWRRLHLLDSLSPATLRHSLDRALALGLGASLVVAGVRPPVAGAEPPRSPISVSATTRPAATARQASADEPVTRTPNPSAPRAGTGASAVGPARPRVVVVRAGDNLWVIAQRALRHRDHPADAADAADAIEIAPYWRRLIAANAATLRSHDPNLIFPGERVVLPPAPGAKPG